MQAHPDLEALERHCAHADPEVARHVAVCSACSAACAALQAQAALVAEVRGALRGNVPRVWAPEPPAIPGYEDLRLVSSGGQGVVWRAHQRSTRRDVALKVLAGAGLAGPRTRARFEREIELASALDHPHLVTVFDSGQAADGAQWFAMQFVDGSPFVHWAREGRVRPEVEVLGTFVLLCRAVDAAHRRGVLHRDLKSSNVLVDTSGAPHVLDFGLAASRLAPERGDDARLTQTGEFMGTLAYASPEHLSGDPRRIDVRSDVYALGVLCFEALTGALPHDVSGSTLEVAHRIVSAPLDRTPLRALHEDLATVLLTSLARDPERRYATAGALGDDVERYLRRDAIDARRDSPLYVLRKALARHRGKVAALAFGFVLTAVAAVVSTTQWRRAVASRSLAVIEAERASELSGFWRSLFDAIDPDIVQGRRLDVREVLEDAARRMHESPPRSAVAELELAASIGRTYHRLGRNDLAWPHLTRAADLARAHLPSDDRRTPALHADAATVALLVAPLADARRAVEVLPDGRVEPHTQGYLRAQLALREGDSARAEHELEGALRLLHAAEEPDLMGALSVLGKMSTLASARGDFGAAERFAREALPLAVRRRGEHGLLALYARHQHALTLEALGRVPEALDLLEDVAERIAASLGPDDPRTVAAQATWHLVRSRAHERAGLADELTRLAKQRQQLVARADLHAATALGAIADLAYELGELRLAVDFAEEQVRCLTELDSASLLTVALAHVGAAEISCELLDAKRAERHARAALAICEAPGEVLVRLAARAHLACASAAALDGRAAAAYEHVRRALELAEQLRGDGALIAARAFRTRSLVQTLLGDLAGAEATLREARARLAAVNGDPTLDAAMGNELGDVLLQLFRPGDAEVELRAALSVRRERLGASHPDTADTANKLGAALFYQQKGAPELPQLWLDALAALEASGTERPALSSVLNNLGAWAQLVEGDMERAESYLRRGLEIGERVHGTEHPLLATSLANVATFDQRRGDLALAQQRLARSLGILQRKHGPDHAHVRQVQGMLQKVEVELAAATAPEQAADPDR